MDPPRILRFAGCLPVWASFSGSAKPIRTAIVNTHVVDASSSTARTRPRHLRRDPNAGWGPFSIPYHRICLGQACSPSLAVSRSPIFIAVTMSKFPLPSAAAPAGLPHDVRLQIVAPSAEPPGGAGWLHEIKHDGHRLLAIVSGDELKLISRNSQSPHSAVSRAVRRAPCRRLTAHHSRWRDGPA